MWHKGSSSDSHRVLVRRLFHRQQQSGPSHVTLCVFYDSNFDFVRKFNFFSSSKAVWPFRCWRRNRYASNVRNNKYLNRFQHFSVSNPLVLPIHDIQMLINSSNKRKESKPSREKRSDGGQHRGKIKLKKSYEIEKRKKH